MTIPAIVQALIAEPPLDLSTPKKTASAPPSFHAQGAFPVQALSVDVKGLGALPPFLQAPDLGRLCELASAASFGLRDQTLLDTTVRDTSEIKASSITLSGWDAVWPDIEASVQQAMGLQGVPLQAHLHNALIYGPGQFFKMHQDTEKMPGMVLTLVLVWPCAHLGGHLMLHQGDDVHRFQSEHLHTDQIQWCAFYADCHHEVRPVQQGHRVVLTFNVVLRPDSKQAKTAHSPALQMALQQHFEGQDGVSSKKRLVVYLDHEYSKKGLSWGLLKGNDRTHAQALRSAADTLGLRVYLALAEIHEMWTADLSDVDYRGRRNIQAEPERDELIEHSTTLDHWVDADNVVQKMGHLQVRDHDIVSIRETDEDDLVNSEYEGYMGNYGETLDYWYRRAAVVLWPQASELLQQFDLDADKALQALVTLAGQPAQAAKVLSTVQAVKARLLRFQSEDPQRFTDQCQIAASLSDPQLALELLETASPWVFGAGHAGGLAVLVKAYGQKFCDELLSRWLQKHDLERQIKSVLSEWTHSYGDTTFREHLLGQTELIPTMMQAGLDLSWIERFAQARCQLWQQLEAQWMTLTPHARDTAWPWRSQFASELIRIGLLLPSTQLAAGVVRQLNEGLGTHSLVVLSPMLIELDKAAHAVAGWSTLRERVKQALDLSLAKALPEQGDWSMVVPVMRCQCTDCRQVMTFLKNHDSANVLLAMAEARRKHILEEFGQSGLRLAMEVLRQGSPHKLRITKPANLREKAAQQRVQHEQWRAALD
ncbi:2OG-Fe(II) oxygenase [Limnohabitans sp. DM1]|uniref:2OG-Fe(II) oxygenase n=1 Tax=Limnohabitans sp. DM1 TaxID=1597955 RepID=UPI000A7FE811|nr:2OG-Fe(II) oxygenase [Limnohabitans sp. DM1]